MSEAEKILAEVIAASEGRIGTHYEGCYKYHAACLAFLIRSLL